MTPVDMKIAANPAAVASETLRIAAFRWRLRPEFSPRAIGRSTNKG
jgi:hypothetical protein